MKNRIMLSVMLLGSTLLTAQQSKVVSAINALGYYQKDKSDVESIQKAKGFIDEASLTESTSGKPKTWWVRGNVYLSFFESKNAELIAQAGGNPLRTAAESYEKAYTLDAKYENAEECYQKAIIAYKNLGIIAFNEKNYAGATELFEKVVLLSAKKGTPDKDGITNTAVAAMNAGNHDKAIEYYSKMVDMDSTGMIYGQIYKAQLAKGDTAAGMTTLKNGRSKFPKNQALLTENLNYLFRTKQNAEAESLLKLAIENDPTNHTLYLAAGSTYETLGRMEEAIAAYKKAVEIKPDAWQAYYNLGAYYNNEGKKLQDAANNEKDNKKYEAGIKAADAQLAIALTYLEKAKELTEKGSSDRMDILKALKQLYVRMNLTEKFEEVKKEMQP
jgi:tetratricopeptide (TPR) repeat protein